MSTSPQASLSVTKAQVERIFEEVAGNPSTATRTHQRCGMGLCVVTANNSSNTQERSCFWVLTQHMDEYYTQIKSQHELSEDLGDILGANIFATYRKNVHRWKNWQDKEGNEGQRREWGCIGLKWAVIYVIDRKQAKGKYIWHRSLCRSDNKTELHECKMWPWCVLTSSPMRSAWQQTSFNKKLGSLCSRTGPATSHDMKGEATVISNQNHKHTEVVDWSGNA